MADHDEIWLVMLRSPFLRSDAGIAAGKADAQKRGLLARSVVIPAAKLAAGQSYDSTIDFFRVGQVISNASYRAVSYRISSTQFTLRTSSNPRS